MKFLAVFCMSFKYLWKNPINVLVLTAFPIVIILILGNALAGFISPTLDFEPFPVAVVADETGRLGEFLASDEIAELLEAKFTDEDTALEKLSEGDVFVVIIEKGNRVSIIKKQGDGGASGIAVPIVESHVQISEAMGIAMASGGDFQELLKVIEAEISVTAAPLGNRVPGAIDYYAVTMLVMILLFTGMNSMELLNKSLLTGTGGRIRSAPVSKPVLIGGLLAASTITSYIQGMITFLFTAFVYGVYWGERIPLVLLTLFGMTLFSQAFGVFLVMLTKNLNAAMGVAQCAFWVMTFVSKGYTKISFGAAEEIFQYAPNSLAHTIIFGSAYGGNEAKMMNSLILLFAYGLILSVIAFILGRRKLS